MEVFGFLKFRRSFSSSGSSTTTTITSSAFDSMHQALEEDDESSFFDLVFAAPNRRNHNDDDDSYKRKISAVEDESKNLSPISLLRSPQKFKVMILGFKKSKLEKTEMNMNNEAKEFPISSLFSRDTSLRTQLNNERYEESSSSSSFSSTSFRSKQFSKQVVQKYVNLIKPLYIRVSKQYNTKKKLCKSLVKSRSTSSSAGVLPVAVNRIDDSVQQQQDGIQSAILYCKRSYSSSSSSSKYEDCSTLSRSVSSCSSVYLQRLINEDDKRISI